MSRVPAVIAMHGLRNVSGKAPRCLRAALLGALALVGPNTLTGQTQSGPSFARIEGSVRDAQNHPVPAATVCLQSADGKKTLTAQTDLEGAYRLSAIPVGAYSFRAQMAGYSDAEFGQLVLKKDEVRKIDLTLTPVGKRQSVTEPEFFDEPQFTVAGVSDTTNLGGHGSDTVRRTTESLARDTSSLGGGTGARSSPSSSSAEPNAAKAGEHHRAAEREEAQGHPVAAEHEYQRAADLDPSEPNLFDWGAELLRHGAVEPAFEVFAKGNRLYPRSTRMLVGLGVTTYARGSHDQAVHHLHAAAELNPDDLVAYQFLGKIEVAEASPSREAQETLAQFAKLHPDDADANYYAAASLWKQRKGLQDAETFARVESLLENAVHLNPRLGPAYLQLGVLYAERGDLPQAISSYEKAVQATPRLAQAHYRLAQAYRQQGETGRARRELETYQQISREADEQAVQERRDIQQFVYTLRDKPTSAR